MLGAAFSTTIQDSDPKLDALDPPLETRIRNKAKEVLVEEELSRRRYVFEVLAVTSRAAS